MADTRTASAQMRLVRKLAIANSWLRQARKEDRFVAGLCARVSSRPGAERRQRLRVRPTRAAAPNQKPSANHRGFLVFGPANT